MLRADANASARALINLRATFDTLWTLYSALEADGPSGPPVQYVIKLVYEEFERELHRRRALIGPEAVAAEHWSLSPPGA